MTEPAPPAYATDRDHGDECADPLPPAPQPLQLPGGMDALHAIVAGLRADVARLTRERDAARQERDGWRAQAAIQQGRMVADLPPPWQQPARLFVTVVEACAGSGLDYGEQIAIVQARQAVAARHAALLANPEAGTRATLARLAAHPVPAGQGLEYCAQCGELAAWCGCTAEGDRE